MEVKGEVGEGKRQGGGEKKGMKRLAETNRFFFFSKKKLKFFRTGFYTG